MRRIGTLRAVGGVTLPILAAGIVLGADAAGDGALRVTAEYRCISPALCDSILVFVEATNESSTEFAGCIVTGLAWNYKPSDSLSAAYASRIDSIEASGGHVCRWHPISIRLGAGLPDDGFNCRELFLVPGEAFLDTLATRTGARDFQEYPGTLDATITIWSGTAGSTWGGAATVGSCRLAINVPR